ncbi:hypothetical protein KJ742_06845 [Patescibacteria group bacterium]|nr:hypothetical protein [Patescibacteria group bacterium]MBU1683629.1 hypothetical protein [Patescibacteria group bacterium]
MKKFVITLFCTLLIIPTAFAASIVSDYSSTIPQNYYETLAPATITADAEGEITAEYGINILIDVDKYILWNVVDFITASGTAVSEGRVDAEIIPEYLEGYKVLHIPVNSDFAEGEFVTLNGLQLRTYDREISSRFLGLDIDGDFTADVIDINSYKVNTSIRTDNIPPYPIENVEYVINGNLTEIEITWDNPPDYDVTSNYIYRTVTRNGSTGLLETLYENMLMESVTDEDVQEGDEIFYEIYVKDSRNLSEAYELNVTIEEPIVDGEEVSGPGQSPAPSEEESAEEPLSDEFEALNSLYNYYKVRYSIKCMPSGVPASANDSACLWARIDVLYAQEMLDYDDVDASLSDWDLELMAKRLKYPEARYEDNCEVADEPASYCSALGKALERVHYFID